MSRVTVGLSDEIIYVLEFVNNPLIIFNNPLIIALWWEVSVDKS